MQNLPDSQLRIEYKTEPIVAKAQNYIGGDGGDTAQKNVSREGRILYILSEQGDNSGGQDTSKLARAVGIRAVNWQRHYLPL